MSEPNIELTNARAMVLKKTSKGQKMNGVCSDVAMTASRLFYWLLHYEELSAINIVIDLFLNG